ncbi:MULTISPECIES: four-carbon acid sugar kinase family protein [Amycolatopsis]|uniref:4-hydroxythreonine-4-phosphate dehydrogenase n=2 Tax=Amycolatopsis TaxID=1813 RepID=A0A1I3Q4S0_9PSEU|nr:four-carbon acid sugar kinase family protein [Amycolatopsis sacchari]SFJ28136.1 4-hydroxythreonine-4-phosphate dehydrogenase [Amycolatopsis sacchari]
MSERLVIVADDLTGAADAAAAYGPHAAVALDTALPDTEVVAIDTDSRHRSPEFAARAVAAAVRSAAGAPLYKKIDSTLRGNIAVEIAAALRELSATALLAPAFPDTGRTVTGGVLRAGTTVRGDLRELFAGSGLSTALIPLDVVRSGPSAVVAAYRSAAADVVCADAVTEADLEVLHAAGEALGPDVLLVGSAGLTRVAARKRGLHAPSFPPAAPGSVLTVLGSYSALAREQRAALMASGEVTTVAVKAPFGPAEQSIAGVELSTVEGDVLLVPDPGAPVERKHAAEVASALASVAGRYVTERRHALAGLVLTGGETARAVLLAAGVRGFAVLGELAPGVVRSAVPALGGLPLITKAGAFGAPDTLEHARRALHAPATASH